LEKNGEKKLGNGLFQKKKIQGGVRTYFLEEITLVTIYVW